MSGPLSSLAEPAGADEEMEKAYSPSLTLPSSADVIRHLTT